MHVKDSLCTFKFNIYIMLIVMYNKAVIFKQLNQKHESMTCSTYSAYFFKKGSFDNEFAI